ncbi:hypothetical protein Agub_g12057, partial [Astrephomene gubernaculifera]
ATEASAGSTPSPPAPLPTPFGSPRVQWSAGPQGSGSGGGGGGGGTPRGSADGSGGGGSGGVWHFNDGTPPAKLEDVEVPPHMAAWSPPLSLKPPPPPAATAAVRQSPGPGGGRASGAATPSSFPDFHRADEEEDNRQRRRLRRQRREAGSRTEPDPHLRPRRGTASRDYQYMPPSPPSTEAPSAPSSFDSGDGGDGGGGGGGSASSGSSSSSVPTEEWAARQAAEAAATGQRAAPHDVEDCENLLEFYYVQAEALLGRLDALNERIDDTEDLVNIDLDNRRNQIVGIDLVVTSITLMFTVITSVAGVFGMNMRNTLEESFTAFWVTTAAAFAGGLLISTAFLGYVAQRRLLMLPGTGSGGGGASGGPGGGEGGGG